MTDAPKRIQVRWTKSGTGHVATPASAGLVANCAAQYLSTEALAASPEVAKLIADAVAMTDHTVDKAALAAKGLRPDAAEILAKEMQMIVAADRWKGRDLHSAPPEKWHKLRPETQQFWTDTATRILAALTAHEAKEADNG